MHVGVPNDRHAKELAAVLSIFGLSQHVTHPAHSRGHTLDELISKDVRMSNVNVVDVMLSVYPTNE